MTQNTLTNSYNYKIYSELFENQISSFSFFVKTATSITGDDVKLTERLSIPSNKLRGFVRGKVGPKDGNDYIGGNFVTSVNLQTSVPILFENSQNLDAVIFLMQLIFGVLITTLQLMILAKLEVQLVLVLIISL